eukprot:CAMPEP_0114147320 /NCGR_PEP_ID=MMETSP0043_2-20121206/21028_1 /TAXON_ID=464988 /ORGANISM="Hemiselmis andersenii, Strain CCMP644" /LENGTH=37 /DNA_ID= /DNA_START= /DNA_END= /DNA_ORIENTATION=
MSRGLSTSASGSKLIGKDLDADMARLPTVAFVCAHGA